jgi:hypothetical protein
MKTDVDGGLTGWRQGCATGMTSSYQTKDANMSNTPTDAAFRQGASCIHAAPPTSEHLYRFRLDAPATGRQVVRQFKEGEA